MLNNDITDIIGDACDVMTPAEERRLKNDLKKGHNISSSQIVKDILVRHKKRYNETPNDTISKKHKIIDIFDMNDKITINMIDNASFNNTDTKWFHKNIKRLNMLEGIDKFNMEDKIELRYKFLESLQQAGMYNNLIKDDIMNDIILSKHSKEIKNILFSKICNIDTTQTEEYHKIISWIKTILSIPHETKSLTNISETLKQLHKNLTAHLYGMDTVVCEILQAVCMILTDPNNKSQILTLVGPPGVGKTTISSMISKSIGMGHCHISCGTINDVSTLMGHELTYIGSKPGMLVQCLINNKQLDNVILLDEMDKINNSKIVPVLLHILDKTQNAHFKDTYCGDVNIDLSKNLYIVSVNSVDTLDTALKDRLKIINIDGYGLTTKIEICKKHILPRLNLKTGLSLYATEQTIADCINKISPTISGVRNLERYFETIYEKLILVKHMGPVYVGLPKTFNINTLKKIDIQLVNYLIK